MAEIADKFTRNEIVSKNEIRQVIGMKPSDDPKADMLINSNISQSNETMAEINGTSNTGDTAEGATTNNSTTTEEDSIVEQFLTSLEAEIDKIVNENMEDEDDEDEE